MNAALARWEIARTGIKGVAGMIGEGPIITSLNRAASETKVRLIRSFDFARCDGMLVNIDQMDAEYPFPDDAPESSLDRLAWAWHHRHELQGVQIDIKTGAPHFAWVDTNTSHVFLVRMIGEEILYVIPRTFVMDLFSARQSRNEIDEQPEMFPSHPGLAPFAVRDDEWPAMLEWIVLGHTDKMLSTSLGMKLPTSWLETMFHFSESRQATSFECVMKLYFWLKEWQPQVHLHNTLTQPLAGDFVLEYKGRRYTIQHKVSDSNPLHLTNYGNFFDLMFWHQGDNADAVLNVLFRNGSCHRTFRYDENGANGLVLYLNRHGEQAQKAHVIDMMQLITEAPPRPRSPNSLPVAPWDAPRAGEVVETRRAKSRCHYMAKRFYEYVNGDQDHLNLPIACIFLNWDQSHIFGEAIVVSHAWTSAEREAFRRFGKMPVTLTTLALSRKRPNCIVLRFCCRNFHLRSKTSSHFPLQQIPVELPLTDQPFFLICAPDGTMETEMPSSLMLFPSGFIDFPDRVKQMWQENREVWADGHTGYQLNLLLGHTQPTTRYPGTMVNDGVVPSNFWLTPDNVVRHIERMFHTVGEMSIQRHESSKISQSFPIADYLTNVSRVIEAALVYGSVRPGSPWRYRADGFYGSRRI